MNSLIMLFFVPLFLLCACGESTRLSREDLQDDRSADRRERRDRDRKRDRDRADRDRKEESKNFLDEEVEDSAEDDNQISRSSAPPAGKTKAGAPKKRTKDYTINVVVNVAEDKAKEVEHIVSFIADGTEGQVKATSVTVRYELDDCLRLKAKDFNTLSVAINFDRKNKDPSTTFSCHNTSSVDGSYSRCTEEGTLSSYTLKLIQKKTKDSILPFGWADEYAWGYEFMPSRTLDLPAQCSVFQQSHE